MKSLRTKIRMLESLVITVGQVCSEAWVLRKTEENLLKFWQKYYLWTVLDTRLTDQISNRSLYKKCGLIPLSKI